MTYYKIGHRIILHWLSMCRYREREREREREKAWTIVILIICRYTRICRTFKGRAFASCKCSYTQCIMSHHTCYIHVGARMFKDTWNNIIALIKLLDLHTHTCTCSWYLQGSSAKMSKGDTCQLICPSHWNATMHGGWLASYSRHSLSYM